MSGLSAFSPRQQWLSVLVNSNAAAIAAAVEGLPLPELRLLRAPEIGLVMARGRMGGIGRQFNLGEITVTRCTVTDGVVQGHGYVRGRDKSKSLLIAQCDAWLQMEACAAAIQDKVIEPLRATLLARRKQTASRAAATKVDFFTLVRGGD